MRGPSGTFVRQAGGSYQGQWADMPPPTRDASATRSAETLDSTFVDVLRERARVQPDERLYTFITDEEGVEVGVSYRELDRAARAVATELQRYLRPGDRALLLHPPGRDYV